MVDVRDAYEARERRLPGLDSTHIEELEVYWAAFTGRRGPVAALDSARKIVSALSDAHGDSPAGRATARLLAQIVGDVWNLEGAAMPDTIARLNAGEGRTEAVRAVLEALVAIGTRAMAAQSALERLLSG